MRDHRSTAGVAVPRWSRDVATNLYIATLWVVTVCLAIVSWRTSGLQRVDATIMLAALAVLSWWLGASAIEANIKFSAGHVAVLASVALVGPLGAGFVGLSMTLLADRRLPLRNRLFNSAMWSSLAMVAGLVYVAMGGESDVSDMQGAGTLLLAIGIPLVVVDVIQTVLNALLLAGVLKLSEGALVRPILLRLLSNSGLTAVGYGVLSFLLVVLWVPVGLGAFSAVFILLPMLGAWWAYRQYGEERQARERTLDALVAAIETKAPHLAGHSHRVANMAHIMAESLGLGPGDVRNVRIAGMLHDVGLVALPTAVVQSGRTDDPLYRSYARRGAHLLREVSFLSGALDGIAHHNDPARNSLDGPEEPSPPDGLAARVVHIADTYDLLTSVGSDDGPPIGHDEAIVRLRERVPAGDASLVDVLVTALTRHPEVGGS